MRRALIVAGALAALALPASAHAFVKSTYSVPVTQPDELGAPVALDTDVYLPSGAAPAGGWPFVEVFHGGGSSKDSEFDAKHAQQLADRGYASLIYSARGHGNSNGQVTVAGPKEIRDLFDVTAWALSHFKLDRERISLFGYSQGGLHVNLAQVWQRDPALNPYGVHFRALLPGHTPDVTFNALVPNGVVKLSFGVGLIGTYYQGTQGKVAPIVDKWVATTVADQPGSYGGGICDVTGHDSGGSSMRADLAARSVGCFADRMTAPSLWVQAFDDGLFPAEMAISMWHRMPDRAQNRLYLSMGGHAAPSAQQAVQDHILGDEFAFLDQHVLGRPASIPPVTYWTRDPAVPVAPDSYRYPLAAWYLQTAGDWPPPGTVDTAYGLGGDGRMVRSGAAAGTLPLAPADQDARHDPVVLAGSSGTPLGTTAATLPRVEAPGFVAGFRTDPLAAPQELSGSPVAHLVWTPAGADSQLVVKVLDQAPDGTLTLLTRGVQGLRGAQPGARQEVRIEASAFSALIPKGHRVVTWVTAGDSSFYKAYPGMAGGTLTAGASTLTLPLRQPSVPAGGPVRARIRLKASPARVSVGRRKRFTFKATTRWGGKRIAVARATVRFAGKRARTNKRGRTRISVRLGRRGRRRARATKRGMRPGTATVRAFRRRAARRRRAPVFTG